MCKCGCRGYCSIYPVLDAWARDLEELSNRSGIQYLVLDIQSDWPAWLEVEGGRYWSHASHPCPLCRVRQQELCQDDAHRVSLDRLPYEPYDMEQYFQDVANFTKASRLILAIIG